MKFNKIIFPQRELFFPFPACSVILIFPSSEVLLYKRIQRHLAKAILADTSAQQYIISELT